MKAKAFIIVVGLVLVGIVGGALMLKQGSPGPVDPAVHVNSDAKTHELVVYKSATCGCCGNWVSYMRTKGYQIEVVNTEDTETIKKDKGVPEELFACHTTIVNNDQYFIEGHIPEEAIAKLLEEEPAIKGIGMPGMPSASPGMPGTKLEPFNISQVMPDNSISNYMRI